MSFAQFRAGITKWLAFQRLQRQVQRRYQALIFGQADRMEDGAGRTSHQSLAQSPVALARSLLILEI